MLLVYRTVALVENTFIELRLVESNALVFGFEVEVPLSSRGFSVVHVVVYFQTPVIRIVDTLNGNSFWVKPHAE